jgi:hypothetical protein
MSGTQSTRGENPSWGRVEIRVKGHLEPRWSEWLDGLTLTCKNDGTTVIEGPVIDQAALFGIIDRLRDMALPLISILHFDRATSTKGNDHLPPVPSGPLPASPRPRSQP